jgi:hypothetical protein
MKVHPDFTSRPPKPVKTCRIRPFLPLLQHLVCCVGIGTVTGCSLFIVLVSSGG